MIEGRLLNCWTGIVIALVFGVALGVFSSLGSLLFFAQVCKP